MIPVSVGVVIIILKIEKNPHIQYLISKAFNAERPIVKFKEISGLKLFAIWNLLLGFGLIVFGFTYKKMDIDGIIWVSSVSFFGASLGWTYAVKYFQEAWKTNAVIIKFIYSIFLVLAFSEKMAKIYEGHVDPPSLFYFTIPPLILLLYSKTKQDINEESRYFWLSSFTFNLVLVGLFFMDGVGEVKTESPSSIGFWLNSFLVIAPTLAAYVSLINLQKYHKNKTEEGLYLNRGFTIVAYLILICFTLFASFGIKTALLFVQNKKVEYNVKKYQFIKEINSKNKEPQSATNPQ